MIKCHYVPKHSPLCMHYFPMPLYLSVNWVTRMGSSSSSFSLFPSTCHIHVPHSICLLSRARTDGWPCQCRCVHQDQKQWFGQCHLSWCKCAAGKWSGRVLILWDEEEKKLTKSEKCFRGNYSLTICLQTVQQSSFASQTIENSLFVVQTASEKDFKKAEMLKRG